MKFLIKSFIYILIFLFAFTVFLPKENLFYYGLKQLKTKDIEITYNKIEENYYKLAINSTNVYYNAVEVMQIQKVKSRLLFFVTSITLENVMIDDMFKKLIPSPERFKKIDLSYSIINPLEIKINGVFDEGNIKGNLNLVDKNLELNFYTSKLFKSKYNRISRLLKYSKETSTKKEDHYRYEYKLQ